MNGYGLDNFHFKTRGICEIFEFFECGNFPHFADGYVVNGGNHARHTLNLFDIVKRNTVLFAVPPESEFHLSLFLLRG